MMYLFVVGCFLTGYLLQQSYLLGEQKSVVLLHWINRWNLFFALPALILVSIPKVNFSLEQLFALLTPWLIFGATFYVISVFASRLQLAKDERLVLILMISMGNTAFVGVPLIASQLGEAAVLSAVIYDQLGSFLLLSFVVSTLIATHRNAVTRSGFLAKFLPVLRFPPFICLLLALFLAGLGDGQLTDTLFWQYAENILSLVSDSLLPLGILAAGLQFRFRVESRAAYMIAAVVGVKMLIFPAVVLAAASWFAIAPVVAKSAVIQSAMPPQITATLMLVAANIAPRLASAMLSFSTLFSLLTLPLWFYIVGFY